VSADLPLTGDELAPVEVGRGAHLATCGQCDGGLIVTEIGVLSHHEDGSHTWTPDEGAGR
jgi:hypothetical protein